MSDEKKQTAPIQQLPGSHFGSGSITLFQIAESHGKHLGSQQASDPNAIVSDRDKEILAKAIPADKIETVLRNATSKVKTNIPAVKNKIKVTRGLVMKHIPTGKKVTILEPDYDTTGEGIPRHRVCLVGTKHKFLVPENNLCL